MEEKKYNMEQLIEMMKNLYCKIQEAKISLLHNKNLDNTYKPDSNLRNQIESNIDDMLEQFDNKDKLKFLKYRIEELIEDRDDYDKEKLQKFFSGTYTILSEKVEKALEELSSYSYGDFVKIEYEPQLIYINEYQTFREVARYKTRKMLQSSKATDNENLDEEILSQYEISLNKKIPEIKEVKFFGEMILGEIMKEGNSKNLIQVLNAVTKAKSEGRQHIGRINVKKGTNEFSFKYDDNLEKSIKKLIEKEKKQPKEDNIENKIEEDTIEQ